MGDVGQSVGAVSRTTRVIQASALIGFGVVSVTCGMLTNEAQVSD